MARQWQNPSDSDTGNNLAEVILEGFLATWFLLKVLIWAKKYKQTFKIRQKLQISKKFLHSEELEKFAHP